MPHHIRQSLSWSYHNDAREFLHRYSLLRPEDFSKSGRVKNFVDVLLAAECILKAHIFHGQSETEPLTLYREVRRLSHGIRPLANRADYLADRAAYDAVANRFDHLSVDLRYSIDMWETYFPALNNAEQVALYDRTVANTEWRRDAVAEVVYLVEQLSPALTRVVDVGAEELLRQELEMAAFAREARIPR